MQIIIAPARRMTVDSDSLPVEQLPAMLDKTKEILAAFRQLSYDEAHRVWWNCSAKIAEPNYRWLFKMDLQRNLTPALLAFTGLQYQYMAPDVFTDDALTYVRQHLRILSGFYGVLRPFDGVVPYRLGLGDRLKVGTAKNLYQFWGDSIARQLSADDSLCLNLASHEYSKAVFAHQQAGQRIVTCVFDQVKGGKLKQATTRAKMARGRMVRFLAENNIRDLAGVKLFHDDGFTYAPEQSSENQLVFIRNVKKGSK